MIALMSFLLIGKAAPVSQVGFSLPVMLLIGLVLGLIGLAFTSYRFVVGYFLAGMLYWLCVEGLHWLVQGFAPNLAVNDSYILAVALSLLPVMLILARPPRMQDKELIANDKARIAAGTRRFILEKDTDFYQHCVRHSSVTEK